jgi:hypothetical protein
VVYLMLFEQLVPVAAFMAAIEAVRSYDVVLGYVAYGIVGTTGFGIILGWIFQNS